MTNVTISPSILIDAAIPLGLAGERLRQTLCIFEDQSGKEWALRPDMTLPLALDVINGKYSPNANYDYDGVAFRLPQKNHPYGSVEERQIGFEWLGQAATPETDAAALAHTIEKLDDFDIDNYTVRIGLMGLFVSVLDAMNLPPIQCERLKSAYLADTPIAPLFEIPPPRYQALARTVANLSDDEACNMLNEIFALSQIKIQGARPLEEIISGLRAIAQESANDAIDLPDEQRSAISALLAFSADIEQTHSAFATLLRKHAIPDTGNIIENLDRHISLLKSTLKTNAHFEMNFPRRFTYYDGFCFEIIGPDNQTMLAGGGRYDTLLARLSSGQCATTAIGAALYPDRIAHTKRAAK